MIEKNICGLILAAGLSSRMNDFKPMLPLRGKTLIENSIDSILSGGTRCIVVVTGYRGDELEKLLNEKYDTRVLCVRNYEYNTKDMLHSVKIGCKALPKCKAFFILPGDMPFVSSDTFSKLIRAFDSGRKIIFPTINSYRKHPPLVDSSLIPAILDFNEDGGLRRLWKNYEDEIYTVPVEDEGVQIDLDTQEEYKKYKIIDKN